MRVRWFDVGVVVVAVAAGLYEFVQAAIVEGSVLGVAFASLLVLAAVAAIILLRQHVRAALARSVASAIITIAAVAALGVLWLLAFNEALPDLPFAAWGELASAVAVGSLVATGGTGVGVAGAQAAASNTATINTDIIDQIRVFILRSPPVGSRQ